jgi:hypothetical protein
MVPYKEQQKMAKLCVEVLDFSQKEDGRLCLDIHPEDLKELWNIRIKLVKQDEVYECSFNEDYLSIFLIEIEDELRIHLIPNTKRQRWLPRLRVLSGDSRCQQ